jgi:exosortase family protein XrtM
MTTTPLRFGLKFIVGFAILMLAFEASRGTSFEKFLVEDLILMPTTRLINAIAPGEHAELIGRTLSSPASQLRVTRGCEGVELFLLLVAAILAFPASPKHRALGLLFGAVLAYVLSVMRLIALHYILRYSPHAWEAMHGLILPLGPVVFMGLYFMRWSDANSRPAAGSTGPRTSENSVAS